VTFSGARPARTIDAVRISRGRSDLADLRDFRLDRFAPLSHRDGDAFAHSYRR
jgi:hypothetical protein